MFVWRVLPGRADARPGAFLGVPGLEAAGIRAAFTTRGGGTSDGAYASLDLSLLAGDDPERVRANRARALEAIGAAPGAWTSGRQVHGGVVHRATAADRGRGAFDPETTVPGVDGLWTDEPGIALAVLAADCVPVLLADPARRRIAVLHAGWRGLVAGILERGVEAVAGDGDPSGVRAYIGPSIGPCCYEVGDDVAALAREALGSEVIVSRDGRRFLDLWDGARRSLRRAGAGAVFHSALCTRSEPHRFFSHRAGAEGRQGLVAMLA